MDKPLMLNKIKSHLNIKTNKDFAEFLEIKPTNLSMWYKRNTFDTELLFKKCEFLNADWLLSGEGSMLKPSREVPEASAQVSSNNNGIPLLPLEAFAGLGDAGIAGVPFDVIEERYEVPLFKQVKVDFMLPVRGSSMYPKYSSGDVVACRLITELLFVQWNKVHVIDSISQGIIMKRLKKGLKEDHVLCKSDNKEYDEFEIPRSDIRNIALVVGVIRLE
ncbi:LexA family transcriptional regulator [Pseudotamlana carrageenivorans]|uniref:Peptidase S24/S26A/S26B/S26C domain-containing protein n=1 Tax=Pseudotamlana carrageenivorans TaxID=2069432 RepID=A0A2I7SF41_9FLAO|nr:S24 family peptidase [Tamlana carrageenivorans]AUS04522.1 hypothetical protein C1A40_03100 [Tamlana carrageenivorans]